MKSGDDPRSVLRERSDQSPDRAPFNLVRHKRTLNQANIDYIGEFAEAAASGKISAYVICAVGPSFATWRGWSGGMLMQERVNLIGQLQLLTSELIEAERKVEDLDRG